MIKYCVWTCRFDNWFMHMFDDIHDADTFYTDIVTFSKHIIAERPTVTMR